MKEALCIESSRWPRVDFTMAAGVGAGEAEYVNWVASHRYQIRGELGELRSALYSGMNIVENSSNNSSIENTVICTVDNVPDSDTYLVGLDRTGALLKATDRDEAE